MEGLGSSDINNHWFQNDMVIGGLAREFYFRVGKRFGQGTAQWRFEPHIAEAVFEELLAAESLLDPASTADAARMRDQQVLAIGTDLCQALGP